MSNVEGLTMAHCAAVVCGHVAAGGVPIRRALRMRSVSDTDSGWQFFCGGADEDPFAAKMRSIEEVLALEPSLAAWLAQPEGTILARAQPSSDWTPARH